GSPTYDDGGFQMYLDGYIAFMLVATALVLMMTVPALALFYGGMVRSKSVLNMMMLSFVAFVITVIVFVLWGWSEGGWFSTAASANGTAINPGYGNGDLIANPFHMFGLNHELPGNFVFVMFQMTFAAITAALISGAIADRVKISSWAVFVPFWLTLVYFPIAHNVWAGGWLYHHFPNLDYAGGTVVHINAGMAGLVLALIIGKRVGWPQNVGKPHNVTLTMIGAGLLWFGWYGFNVGSIVQAAACTSTTKTATCDPSYSGSLVKGVWTPGSQFPSEMAVTFLNTTVATAAACLAWLLVERIIHKKFTSLGAASGIVAGLVAITPSCGAVSTAGAIGVGVLAGAVCAVAINLKYKVGLDDSLDVVGVHLVGGILGALSIGFLGTRTSPQGLDNFFPDNANGLFYGGDWELLGHQAAGVLFTLVWCGVITAILGLIIKYTIKWRVTPEEEVEGIDIVEHGESAYDLDNRSGGVLTTGVLGSHSKEGALA
ncbi:MAG: ammonium transporter, partial [Marmoricola sp.]